MGVNVGNNGEIYYTSLQAEPLLFFCLGTFYKYEYHNLDMMLEFLKILVPDETLKIYNKNGRMEIQSKYRKTIIKFMETQWTMEELEKHYETFLKNQTSKNLSNIKTEFSIG